MPVNTAGTREAFPLRHFLTFIVFLAPASRLKNIALAWLGHDVARSARIAPNVVYKVRRISIGGGAVVGPFNVFRSLLEVTLQPRSIVGQLNWFSMAPEFADHGGTAGCLVLEDSATVVSRHYVDCSGGVFLRPFSILGGMHSIVLTHQLDYRTNRVACAAVEVGTYSLVNAANRLVPGVIVPDRCITGIGSVLLPGYTQSDRLYAGVPAKDIKSVKGGLMFERREAQTGL